MSRRSRKTRAPTSMSTAASVGNQRHIVVSDQAGRVQHPGAAARCSASRSTPSIRSSAPLLEEVKEREFNGYAYDGAEASFELLARRMLDSVPEYFQRAALPRHRRAALEREGRARHRVGSDHQRRSSTASTFMTSPRAMTARSTRSTSALRKALIPIYPELDDIQLTDYKVRILTPQDGTEAVTRVMIETSDKQRELVHGRRLDQHHRRLLQRAARQHHLSGCGASGRRG